MVTASVINFSVWVSHRAGCTKSEPTGMWVCEGADLGSSPTGWSAERGLRKSGETAVAEEGLGSKKPEISSGRDPRRLKKLPNRRSSCPLFVASNHEMTPRVRRDSQGTHP